MTSNTPSDHPENDRISEDTDTIDPALMKIVQEFKAARERLEEGGPEVNYPLLVALEDGDLNAKERETVMRLIARYRAWFDAFEDVRCAVAGVEPPSRDKAEQPNVLAQLVEKMRVGLEDGGPEVDHSLLAAYIDKQLEPKERETISSLIGTFRNWNDAYWKVWFAIKEADEPLPGETSEQDHRKAE